MPSRVEQRARLADLAARQGGVVARQQALVVGMSSSAVGRRVAVGRWTVLHPGVYRVDGAEPTDLARVWAAVLYAAGGRLEHTGRARAAVAGRTALWLWGGLDRCPDVVEIAVLADRRVAARSGLRLWVRRNLRTSPQQPPRQPVLDAALEAVQAARSDAEVVDLVLTLTSRRLTTADRLAAAVAERARLRRRALVMSLCEQVVAGVQSPLERVYLRRVERTHGLPVGERNLREAAPGGGNWYRDVRYRAQRVVVELDGRAAHPASLAFRDRRRDNHAAGRHELTLRYGWHEVAGDGCGVAVEVGQLLGRRGWQGAPKPCRPGCPAATPDYGEGFFPLSGNDASA